MLMTMIPMVMSGKPQCTGMCLGGMMMLYNDDDDNDNDNGGNDDVRYQENPDALVSGLGGKTMAGLSNFIESPLKPPRYRGDDQHIEEYDHEYSNDFGEKIICMYYDDHHESSFLNDGILDFPGPWHYFPFLEVFHLLLPDDCQL